MFKTVNGGTTWVQQPYVPFITGIRVGLSGVFCVNEDACWVSGGGETVYKTEDGGDEWEPQSTGGEVSGISGIYFKNTTTGWVTGQSVVRHTTDSGDSWVNQVSDIPGDATELGLFPVSIVKSVHFSGRVGWVVGDDGNIFRLNEPLVATVREPNMTRTVPNRTIPEPDPDVECVPFMDDCEAGYYPLPEYDDNGCAIDYTCVQEGDITLEKIQNFIGQVPGLGKNEYINIYVTRKDGIVKEWGIILENGNVKEVKHVQLNNPTIMVWLSESTVKKIMDSDDKASTTIKAYKNREITIKAKTFGGKLKLLFVKVFSWFKK